MGGCCNECCSNICGDCFTDPPSPHLSKDEDAFETFHNTGISFAIIGVEEPNNEQTIKEALELCRKHNKDDKYRFHSSIFVYCSDDSKTGYCLDYGRFYKKIDRIYDKGDRFYYHKEKESEGGVRFQKLKVEDYINNKCKEGCIYLTTDILNGKSFMEKAEKNFVFDVKNFNAVTHNCHTFVLEAVTALSAKKRNGIEHKNEENFVDEIKKVII